MSLDSYQDLYVVQMNDMAWNSVRRTAYPPERLACVCGCDATYGVIALVRTSRLGDYLLKRVHPDCGHVVGLGQIKAVLAPDVLTRLILEVA